MSLHTREQALVRLREIEETEYIGPISRYIDLLERDNAALKEANKQTQGSSSPECTCRQRKSIRLSMGKYLSEDLDK